MKVNENTVLYSRVPVPTLEGKTKRISVPQVVTDLRTGPETYLMEYDVTSLPPTVNFGSETKGNWQGISQNHRIYTGDILRFTYTFKIPIFKEWQANRFIAKLQEDDRYQLRQWTLSDEQGRLWVEVKVLKPDFGITAILIASAVAAIGIGIGFWLTTESIEKLFTVEVGDTKINFSLIAGIALVIFGLPLLLKKV